jgi:hypothetical protein
MRFGSMATSNSSPMAGIAIRTIALSRRQRRKRAVDRRPQDRLAQMQWQSEATRAGVRARTPALDGQRSNEKSQKGESRSTARMVCGPCSDLIWSPGLNFDALPITIEIIWFG